MTDEPVRWGLLSTARINGSLLGGIRAAPNAEVVAVASRDGARAQAYAARHGIPVAHGSYEALLADPAVEVVYNSLPNALHVPWTVRALEAGKHVLCEKPLTRWAAEAEAAFAAAERAGRRLSEAFMWRHHPQTATLVEAAAALGPLRVVRAWFGFPLPADDTANVRLQAALDGGALMDVGCYCVSALRLLLGEPLRVSGEAVTGPDGVDVRFAGTLRFAGDVLGAFDCGMDVPRRAGIEVVGTEGTLLSADPWPGAAPELVRVRPDGTREALPVEPADPYALEVEDLSAAVRSGGEPKLGRADAVAQARVIEALYRAATECRSVAGRAG